MEDILCTLRGRRAKQSSPKVSARTDGMAAYACTMMESWGPPGAKAQNRICLALLRLEDGKRVGACCWDEVDRVGRVGIRRVG